MNWAVKVEEHRIYRVAWRSPTARYRDNRRRSGRRNVHNNKSEPSLGDSGDTCQWFQATCQERICSATSSFGKSRITIYVPKGKSATRVALLALKLQARLHGFCRYSICNLFPNLCNVLDCSRRVDSFQSISSRLRIQRPYSENIIPTTRNGHVEEMRSVCGSFSF